MTADAPADDDRTILYYDGACPLCRAEVAHYANLDTGGNLSLVDVSQSDAALPESLEVADAKARFHVRSAEGDLLSGAPAFAEVWRQVPGWRLAGRVAQWPGVMALLELAYRGFLRLRPGIVRVFAATRRKRKL